MGILIVAAFTTVLCLTVIGGFVGWRSPRNEWGLLALLVVFELGMSPLAFYGVRLPLDGLLKGWIADVGTYRFVSTFYAPLTEEPTKLWPLLLPWVWRSLSRENAVRRAMALGLGFGIGEIWFLAEIIHRNDPVTAALPWWQLGGFLNERFMVCVMHGAFSAVAIRGRWWGVPAAMTLHFFGNFPIYLRGINAFGWGANVWTNIIGLWVVAYFLTMMFILCWMIAGNLRIGRLLFGDATCPDCGIVYPCPLFRLNLGIKRLERCPGCKKWHLL
ncbi:MAG: hypothetical protein HZA46_13520 [Planctomycetales bacterium]|nr:hypothetical protein [Planctomycetales bacterium]